MYIHIYIHIYIYICIYSKWLILASGFLQLCLIPVSCPALLPVSLSVCLVVLCIARVLVTGLFRSSLSVSSHLGSPNPWTHYSGHVKWTWEALIHQLNLEVGSVSTGANADDPHLANGLMGCGSYADGRCAFRHLPLVSKRTSVLKGQ